MKLLIGAPIKNRSWALPYWFNAIERACETVEVTPVYVFVIDPNDPSTALINRECSDREVHFVWTYEEDFDEERNWNNERYLRMAQLRNMLLKKVRELSPDYFLSLDSDIFVHPDSLKSLFEVIEEYDAVGGKCYMSAGRRAPSYAMLPCTSLVRPDSSAVLRVDCIMAMKLMKPSAYNIDYEPHGHGEDIGISMAWKRAGLRIGWDGRITNRHCMSPEDLDLLDSRCEWETHYRSLSLCDNAAWRFSML